MSEALSSRPTEQHVLSPRLARFDSAVEWLVTWAARLGGVFLLAVGFFVFYEVVCRYVFNAPTLWVMDYSIYFVMWGVFLGTAYTMRSRGHVLVDVLVKRLTAPIRRSVALGAHLLILSFSLCLVAAGVRSNISAYQMNELTMSALYIPLWYPLSSIPVGFALLALEEISALARIWQTGAAMEEVHEP